MSPRVRRTFAFVAILVIAAVVLVLWRTPLGTTVPAGEGDAEASTGRERVSLSNDTRVPIPDDVPTALSAPAESETRRDEAEASQPKVWVDLTVHVTTPTGSLDNQIYRKGHLFDDRGADDEAVLRNDQCSFKEIRPGKVAFFFVAPGYKPVERWLLLQEDEPFHREEVVLEPAWSLTVHLTSGMRTFLGELHEISGDRERTEYPSAIVASVDPPGHPTAMKHVMRNQWILNVHSDDWQLDLLDDPPVHVSVFFGNQLLATQRLDTRVEEITLDIPVDHLRSTVSELTCRVVDQYTAGPIEGVKAILVTSRVPHAVIASDSEGFVRFPAQAPGVYRLDLDWENRFLSSYTVQLEAGKTTDLGTILLSSGVEISGRFSDGDEKPDRVWSAWIVADDSESGEPSLSGTPRPIHVSLDGRFKTLGFAAGRYRLGGISNDRMGKIFRVSKHVLVDTRSARVQDLEIQMERPVYLHVRPTFPDFEDYECVVRSSDGLYRLGGAFHELMNSVIRIPPGSYVLTFLRGREVLTKIPFVAGSAPFVRVDVP